MQPVDKPVRVASRVTEIEIIGIDVSVSDLVKLLLKLSVAMIPTAIVLGGIYAGAVSLLHVLAR